MHLQNTPEKYSILPHVKKSFYGNKDIITAYFLSCSEHKNMSEITKTFGANSDGLELGKWVGFRGLVN